jgi:hypothetical protein
MQNAQVRGLVTDFLVNAHAKYGRQDGLVKKWRARSPVQHNVVGKERVHLYLSGQLIQEMRLVIYGV